MKKITAFLLAVCMLITEAGCGAQPKEENGQLENKATAEKHRIGNMIVPVLCFSVD